MALDFGETLGVGMLGGLLDFGMGLFGQSAAKKAAQAQMDFQERMRATQYQTTVADMRAAGLNPILATKLGGAGTPSGAMAATPDFQGGMSRSVQSAVALSRNSAEVDLMKAQADKLRVETDRETRLLPKTEFDVEAAKQTVAEIVSRTHLNNDQAWKIIQLTPVEKEKLMADVAILKERYHEAHSAAVASRIVTEYLESADGRILRTIGLGKDDVEKLLTVPGGLFAASRGLQHLMNKYGPSFSMPSGGKGAPHYPAPPKGAGGYSGASGFDYVAP